MIDFESMCQARAKAGEKDYIILECVTCGHAGAGVPSIENGLTWWCPACQSMQPYKYVNAAMHRNCALDVAEELADAVNIMRLWAEREDTTTGRIRWLSSVAGQLENCGLAMLLVAESMHDDYPVDRSKDGLEGASSE